MMMKTQIDSSFVKKMGTEAGATIVGIASSNDFSSAPDGYRPSDVLEGCLSVIVLGVPFPKEVLDNAVDYTAVRNATATKMTEIAKDVAKGVKDCGYKTKAISSIGGKYVDGITRGNISLKHAAELAGLGFIGRNYLLINPRYGNLLWFSAVLTDADLVPDERQRYDICSGCNRCVEACPGGALDDPAVFKKKVCAGIFYKMVNKKWVIVCYKCRTSCPYCSEFNGVEAV
jgi:epoxyqueuosine reductase QueG